MHTDTMLINACDLCHFHALTYQAPQVLQVFSLPSDALELVSTHSYAQDSLPLAFGSCALESQDE